MREEIKMHISLERRRVDQMTHKPVLLVPVCAVKGFLSKRHSIVIERPFTVLPYDRTGKSLDGGLYQLMLALRIWNMGLH